MAAGPERLAVSCKGTVWTYAELAAQANRVRRRLAARCDFGPERTVALALRRSPAYSWHEAQGAVFGEKGGWERVNYYRSNEAGGDESKRPLGWAGKLWSPAIEAEHRATRESAGLFDESSFAKISITGPDAAPFVERVCDNRVARAVGDVTYTQLLKDYYGDAIDMNPFTGITWSRIPHFFNSPYYVYQYATCFASAAKIARQIMAGGPGAEEARERFLALLRSGGSDYPMELLRKAGVDLSQPDTVRAVVDQLDGLVTRLERELEAL